MKKKEKSEKSNKSKTVQIKGLQKPVVNFKPTTDGDEPTKYTGQSDAAATLKPMSSNDTEGRDRAVVEMLTISDRMRMAASSRRQGYSSERQDAIYRMRRRTIDSPHISQLANRKIRTFLGKTTQGLPNYRNADVTIRARARRGLSDMGNVQNSYLNSVKFVTKQKRLRKILAGQSPKPSRMVGRYGRIDSETEYENMSTISEGRKSKAEIARIAQAKKDNRTLLSTVGSARSMNRTLEGKRPMKTVSSNPASEVDVVRSAVRSLVSIKKQAAALKPKDSGMKLGPVRLSSTMSNSNSLPPVSVDVSFNKTKKQALPAVTIPEPTPAQKTLRPRSSAAPKKKPSLLAKLFSKLGRYVNDKATDMFDLDDRKAKLEKIRKSGDYRSALIKTKGEAKRKVTRSKSDSENEDIRAQTRNRIDRQSMRSSATSALMKARAAKKDEIMNTQMHIDALGLSQEIAKELNKTKIETQRKQLLSVNNAISALMDAKIKGQISDTDFERAMSKHHSMFSKIKGWPLKYNTNMLSSEGIVIDSEVIDESIHKKPAVKAAGHPSLTTRQTLAKLYQHHAAKDYAHLADGAEEAKKEAKAAAKPTTKKKPSSTKAGTSANRPKKTIKPTKTAGRPSEQGDAVVVKHHPKRGFTFRLRSLGGAQADG